MKLDWTRGVHEGQYMDSKMYRMASQKWEEIKRQTENKMARLYLAFASDNLVQKIERLTTITEGYFQQWSDTAIHSLGKNNKNDEIKGSNKVLLMFIFSPSIV